MSLTAVVSRDTPAARVGHGARELAGRRGQTGVATSDWSDSAVLAFARAAMNQGALSAGRRLEVDAIPGASPEAAPALATRRWAVGAVRARSYRSAPGPLRLGGRCALFGWRGNVAPVLAARPGDVLRRQKGSGLRCAPGLSGENVRAPPPV